MLFSLCLNAGNLPSIQSPFQLPRSQRPHAVDTRGSFASRSPIRHRADGMSLPTGAPRPDRHVPFLQGKDLLSLSPTGEEVSLQTVSFGDARALVPGGAR